MKLLVQKCVLKRTDYLSTSNKIAWWSISNPKSQLRNKLEHKLNSVFPHFLDDFDDFIALFKFPSTNYWNFGYWIPSLSTYLPLKKFSVSVSWVPMMEVVSPHIIIRTRTPSSAFFSKSSPRVKEAKSTSVLVFKSCQSLPLETKEKSKGK